MSRKRLLTALSAALIMGGAALAGCSSSGASSSPSAGPSTTVVSAGGAGTASRSASGAGQALTGQPAPTSHAGGGGSSVGLEVAVASPLVIRTGTVTLSVRKRLLVGVFDKVSAAAELLGGFVAGSSSNLAAGFAGSSLTVRVPSAQFATLVREVDGFGKVQAQSESGRDVTGTVVDLGARIRNLESEEAALRTLLSRAGSIPAILQVQDQLFGVEGEVEQLAAQQASLVDHATFATLTVDLVPLAVPAPKPKHPKENAFVRAIHLALHNSWVAVRGVLLAIGWAFPALVLGLLVLGGWRLRRRFVSRRGAAEAPSA